ncbi:MAG: hypothetical protein ACHBNF_16785 [Chromatiales bacterium]
MSRTQSPIQIPGYTYGTSAVAKSPLSEQDFDLLKPSPRSSPGRSVPASAVAVDPEGILSKACIA